MSRKKIAIVGGSGFVGTVIASRLSTRGDEVSVLTRSRENSKHLWPLPNAKIIETDVFDSKKLGQIVSGMDAVINLVGILNEKKDNGEGFHRAHVELTEQLLSACEKNGVHRYLHMSALNADSFAPSYYLRTKGEAENKVLAAGDRSLNVTIFRPSVIFGRGDGLFNRFHQLLKISPVLPLACARTRFQPVFVGDVADAFLGTLGNKTSFGRKYDLGGPDIVTLKEIVDYVNQVSGLNRIVLPLGDRLSKIQAQVFEYVPGKPFSKDNLRSASEDSVIVNENGLELLGIKPTSFRSVVPKYIDGDARSHYYALRSDAKR
ncbi:MAG: complex I NDUFA9 subunit family protein [Gammaproteobacteria bacterium]